MTISLGGDPLKRLNCLTNIYSANKTWGLTKMQIQTIQRLFGRQYHKKILKGEMREQRISCILH